jgi:hypothetical protein
MEGIKCNACGLVNAAYNLLCRRCKQDLNLNPLRVLPSGADSGPSYFPYVLVAIIVGVAGLVTFGFYRSFSNVSTVDLKRSEEMHKEQLEKFEAQRAEEPKAPELKFKMPDANKFADVRKLDQDAQKALQPTLDKMQKENDRMRETAAKAEEYRIRSLPPPPTSH